MPKQTLKEMLKSLNQLGASGNQPKTLIYNEGWMLRLILQAAEEGYLPNLIEPARNWFSEAKLFTPFARNRGRTAEGATSADAVMGDFDWALGTRSGVRLLPTATRFEVFEAKMFSGLSTNVTNARNYDQISRTIACMAHVISLSNLKIGRNDFNQICFWLIAPRERIKAGRFNNLLKKQSIQTKVQKRIQQFHAKDREELEAWYEQYFKPLIDHSYDGDNTLIRCISWETLLKNIENDDLNKQLNKFYNKCLQVANKDEYSNSASLPRRGYYYRNDQNLEEVVICHSRKFSSRVFQPGTSRKSYVVANNKLTLLEKIDPCLLEAPQIGSVFKWNNQDIEVISNGPCKSKVKDRTTGETDSIDNHILINLQKLQGGNPA